MSSPGDKIRSAGERISKVSLGVPTWLMTAGLAGWLLLGIVISIALVGWLFAYSSSVSIPLLLAIVVGMIAHPLCEKMIDRGLNKSLAAGIVLMMLAVMIVAVVWVTGAGIVSQWPAVQAQIGRAAEDLAVSLQSMGLDGDAIKGLIESAGQNASTVVSKGGLTNGLLSSVGSAVAGSLSGLFNLAFSAFIAATLLFYVLSDFPSMANWASGHMFGLPRQVSDGIVDDAVSAMRGYFRGTTITGISVAAMIGIAMLVLRVPLAGTVALVTFMTCYIPFFGAIISGAFAFIVALGSNGLTTALILLVIVLLAQNILQTVISARVMGDSLNLHPLVVLVVTMLGGIFGGLLGAALGAPVAALFVNAGARLSKEIKIDTDEDGPRIVPLEAGS